MPAVTAPWAADLITVAALPVGARVLDVACGTGIVARLAAPHVGQTGQVRGMDLNPRMLAVARALPSTPGAPITWQARNAVALPFPEATFDRVLCQQGLQFFSDRLAAKREILVGMEHRQHRYLNNRAENSHQPTRPRERRRQRFTSPGQVQRFFSAYGPIAHHFRSRRHRLSAPEYRHEMRKRFQMWREITGTVKAA
jgi:SAM-dependent methyltransferase